MFTIMSAYLAKPRETAPRRTFKNSLLEPLLPKKPAACPVKKTSAHPGSVQPMDRDNQDGHKLG